MHGFAQGELLLSSICNDLKYDVIFVQEHWLSSDQLYKLLVPISFLLVSLQWIQHCLILLCTADPLEVCQF